MTNIPLALLKQLDIKKKHKYGAIACKCLHGHEHDSHKEAMWCVKLHQEQREGKIRNLLMQTTYDLRVNGVDICKHILDFDYDRLSMQGLTNVTGFVWKPEVVDVKGMKLPVWSLKHKLFMACYPEIKYVVV